MQMDLLSLTGRPARLSRIWPFTLLALLILSCRQEEIRVYTAPKEKAPPPHAHAAAPGPAQPRPQLTWTLPNGWRETEPGRMSVAGFSIAGPDGQEAQVSITPLPILAGQEALIVNMWRQQVGLGTNSTEEIAQQLRPIEVGGESGSLFEVTGTAKESGQPARIVTAMVHRPDGSWFYKLAGDVPMVEAQKPAFIEFLKSIRIKAAAPVEVASAAGSTPRNWQVPSQWKVLPAGQMQVAKFAVPTRSGAKADVSVSIFPNDTGGRLANVNRWRNQIGLAEVTESGLAPLVSALDPANPEAILVDMTNNDRRLIGAIIPRNGSYWFYKLLGDSDAVAPEKEAFVAFAKSPP